MVVVRAATVEEWQVLRDIRLAALRDAPNAFGSTYVEQAASVEADWRRRISRGGTFFAYVPEVKGNEPSGLVGAFQEKTGTVELVSLWVRPYARGRGVGEALVAAVIEWARAAERQLSTSLADGGEPALPACSTSAAVSGQRTSVSRCQPSRTSRRSA